MSVQSQNTIIVLKKQNVRGVLKLNNTNYTINRRNIIIMNKYHKENMIYVLQKEIFALIPYTFYVNNIIKIRLKIVKIVMSC